MKRILITGVNSYIGNAVGEYLLQYNQQQGADVYQVDKLSLRDGALEERFFQGYDCIFHVAGKAHADVGTVSEEQQKEYYRVNCDLAVAVAEKASVEGVSQFIYLSSVIVYGNSAGAGKEKHITADTIPTPANFYGDSKWQAEQRLQELEQKIVTGQIVAKEQTGQEQQQISFSIAILRLPMVYGKGSKGNFPLLVKMARLTPIFPRIKNRRSMIYVENLAEFVRLLIDSGKGGLYFPQDEEYVTTAGMVQLIAEALGKKLHLWKILNPLVLLASKVPGKIGSMADKAFGSLTVDQSLSQQDFKDYQRYSLEESIQRTLS